MKDAVMVNGNAYRSFSAACQAYGLHHMQVKRLMTKDGVDMETAIYALAAQTHNTKVFAGTHWTAHEGYDAALKLFRSPDGRTFGSFREMCLTYGQEPSVVRSRLKKMDLAFALLSRKTIKELQVTSSQLKVWSSQGKVCFVTYTELVKRASQVKTKHQTINTDALKSQINNSGTLDIAELENIVSNALQSKQIYTYDDQEYTCSELYRQISKTQVNPVSMSTFRNQIIKGVEPDIAIRKRPIINRKKLPSVTLAQWHYHEESGCFIAPDGKEYNSRLQMCKAYDKPMGVVTRRLAYGMTLEQALTRSGRTHYSRPTDANADMSMFGYNTQKNAWTLDGTDFYPTMRKMCQAAGISSIWWRIGIEQGYDKSIVLQRALEFPITGVTYHGQTYNVTKLVRMYHTGSGTVALRMLKKNCDFETALDAIISSQEKERKTKCQK